MEDRKLFFVEFGEPRTSGGILSFAFANNILSPVYVVAKDYNEAASKAMAYAEYKQTFGEKGSVLTSDGSLRNQKKEDAEIKIRAISVVSDDVIW
jgi:hypothetical protein